MATITTTITTTISHPSFYQTYWKEYELYCMKYHHEKYGHTTWHWTNVPETVLLESGYIHDFNRLRLKRKEVYEKDGVYYNSIREYGLDGFAVEKRTDDQLIYHGIQTKLWEPKSVLTGSDLGTFRAAIWERLRMKSSDSKGYLYHTCRLQADVRDDMLNTRGIIQQELLPFDDLRCNSMHLASLDPSGANIVDRDHLGLVPTVEETKVNTPTESTYTLRGYQEEAITMLGMGWSGIGLLNLPCGTGKTVIFSNHLKEKKYKNVIIVSPLRVQAEQTLKRVKAFLPGYQELLLDSDGSTDVGVLNQMMKKKSIISTTFKLMVQVIKKLFIDSGSASDSETDSSESVYEPLVDLSNSILIIDEAHNIVSASDEKQELIKLIRSFSKTLLVTATPPSCMEEMIGCTTIYQYPFQCAIEEGHICDYEVYLPVVTMNESSEESTVFIEKPIELSDLNGDMVQKSLYLLSGMLQTGSRRCIAYLSKKKECREFMKVLIETNQKYHYLDLSVSSITNLTSASKRNKIIDEFQKDDGRGEIKILCSIRILDEGIDIPDCDSVFVGNVTESSNEIKMVQRICRANRLVESRLNKVARCFIWTDDYQKILGSLSLLKSNDIEFHKKIKAMNGNYDKSGHTETTEICKKQNAMINEFIKVKCMTYKEIWEMRLQQLFRFVIKYGRMPSSTSKKVDEKSLRRWYNSQMTKITSIEHSFYKKLSENETVKKAMDKIIEERNIDKWEESKKSYLKFVIDYGRMPSRYRKNKNESVLANWYTVQLTKITSTEHDFYKKLSVNEIVKNTMDKTIEERGVNKWEQSKCSYLKFVDDNGWMPSTHGKNTEEKRHARWFGQQMAKITSTEHDYYKELAQNEIVKKAMDKTIEERDIDRCAESMKSYLKFVVDHERMPSTISKDADEKILAIWYGHQTLKITSVEHDIYKKLSVNEIVKKAMDKIIEKRGKALSWEESKKSYFKFIDDNGMMPSTISMNTYEIRLGRWYSQQLKKITLVKDDIYNKLSENEIVKKAMDRTLLNRSKRTKE